MTSVNDDQMTQMVPAHNDKSKNLDLKNVTLNPKKS